MRTHPHAEALYEIIPLDAGGFGVKVSIADTSPTTVSSFATKAAAEAWIASHKGRVQAWSQPGTIFRRSKPTDRIGDVVVRKPNYRFERAERDRTKLAKKEAKEQRQQERALQKTAEEGDHPAPSTRSE